MFNPKTKDEFLKLVKKESEIRNQSRFQNEERVSEAITNTVNTYSIVFRSSEKFEYEFKKDLYDFTIDEIEDFLFSRKPRTKTSSRTIGRIVTKYINWAIENNLSVYKNIAENPLNVEQIYFNKFVKEENTQYLSVDEVKDVIDSLVNDQDAVIVALMFNGIHGKEVSEIRNLTIGDVDFKNKSVTATNNSGNKRIVSLSNDELDTLKTIKRAWSEDSYIKKNGEMEYISNVRDTMELPSHEETKYIIKPRKPKNGYIEKPVNQYLIYNRIDMIRELDDFEDISDKLIIKNIVRSGMIFEAKRLLELEGGELDHEKIKRICEKFDVELHWAVKDFLNIDTINNIYNNK